jgi:hypothetical protein
MEHLSAARLRAARQFRSSSTNEVTTVTIVRVGTNKKYSEGWEAAFGKGPKRAKPAKGAKKPARSTKKAAKSSSKKRPAKGKRK